MLSFKDVTLDDALSWGLRSVEEQQEIKKYIICKVKIRAVKKKKAKEGGQERRWEVNGGGRLFEEDLTDEMMEEQRPE